VISGFLSFLSVIRSCLVRCLIETILSLEVFFILRGVLSRHDTRFGPFFLPFRSRSQCFSLIAFMAKVWIFARFTEVEGKVEGIGYCTVIDFSVSTLSRALFRIGRSLVPGFHVLGFFFDWAQDFGDRACRNSRVYHAFFFAACFLPLFYFCFVVLMSPRICGCIQCLQEYIGSWSLAPLFCLLLAPTSNGTLEMSIFFSSLIPITID